MLGAVSENPGTGMSPIELSFLAITGGMLAGILALTLVLWFAPQPRKDLHRSPPQALAEPRQFVFRNGYLVEHSDNIAFLVATPVDHLKAWEQLVDVLSEIADGVHAAFEDLRDTGRPFRIEGLFGTDRIHVMGVRQGEDLRITVASIETEQTSMRVDIATLAVLEADLELLSQSTDSTPTLSWTVDSENRVVWANATYLALAAKCHGPDATRGWPVAVLFPDEGNSPPPISRRQVIDARGRQRWFEITALPVNDRGLRHMHALSLDAVIAAEDNLRTFIQTLTRTFAYLPTGLAIFDQDRTLAMFNPALMDMTSLDGSWLSRRPKLEDFFDALRDQSKLPEPRDYKAWRDGLSDLSRVDAGGTYRETWTLPTGQTYCVTGRPQADGAVALMLEDISADISATRAHRREREALVGALDAVDAAVVVFAGDGTRLAANEPARQMLCPEPGGEIPATLDEGIAQWRTRFLPSPAWADLRSFAASGSPDAERTDWTETLHRQGAGDVSLRIIPTRGGGLTLVFNELPPEVSPASERARALAEPVS